jgi:hypothetical protein
VERASPLPICGLFACHTTVFPWPAHLELFRGKLRATSRIGTNPDVIDHLGRFDALKVKLAQEHRVTARSELSQGTSLCLPYGFSCPTQALGDLL